MDTIQFLSRVWPASGHYCIVTRRSKADKSWWQHDVFPTIAQAAAKAIELSRTTDVYFSLFTLKQARVWDATKRDGEGGWSYRKHENMAECRCLFGDMDVGEGKDFASRDEARAALEAFLKATDLPHPLVVSSGRGYHLYWTFDRALPAESWKEMAQTFRKLCAQASFRLDPTRITDLSSVLRVVGTRHLKDPANPLLVKAAFVPSAVNVVEELQAKIERALAQTRPGSEQSLFEGAKPGEVFAGDKPEGWEGTAPPLADIGEACAQVRWAAGHQPDVAEPQWYAAISVVRHAAEGDRAAHFISMRHPEYDADATDAKLAQLAKGNFGPTTCGKLADLFGGERCAKCWYKGNPNSSPVAAARNLPRKPPVSGENGVEIDCPVPQPYTRLRTGGVRYSPLDGEPPRIICTYDLFPKAIIHIPEEKRREIVWAVELPKHGLVDFTTPASAVYDMRELQTILGNEGIFEEYDNLKYIKGYMSAYVKMLQKHVLDSKQQTHLGWTEDYKSFVLPDKLVTNGEHKPVSTSVGVQNASQAIRKKGTLERQVATLRFYEHPDYVRQQFLICCSLAAPLLHGTEHHGVLVNMSGDTGASKTTALLAAAGIWGSPDASMINGTQDGATIRARNERVMLMSNLPVCVDEITHMDREDAKNLAMSITQPGGRKRLDNKGVEKKDVSSLKSTFMLCTSNNSLHDLLSQGNAAGTAGSMRVFEIACPRLTVHTKRDADDFLRALKEDYGHIGPAFIDHLTRYRLKIVEEMIAFGRELDASCGVGPEERFWSDAIQCAIMGARIGESLGLLPFKPSVIEAWATAPQLARMRSTVSNSYASPVETIAGYIAQIANDILVVRADKSDGRFTVVKGPMRELAGRYELDTKTLYLTHQLLKRHCGRVGAPLNSLLADLQKQGVAEVTRYTLGKGISEYNVGQTSVVKLDMRHAAIAGQTDMEHVAEVSNVVSIRSGRTA